MLGTISKHFSPYCLQETLRINKNNLLNYNQCGFHSARSIADVFTVIIHRMSDVSDHKFITRTIVLNISKALIRYDVKICERAVSIIKSFLNH